MNRPRNGLKKSLADLRPGTILTQADMSVTQNLVRCEREGMYPSVHSSRNDRPNRWVVCIQINGVQTPLYWCTRYNSASAFVKALSKDKFGFTCWLTRISGYQNIVSPRLIILPTISEPFEPVHDDREPHHHSQFVDLFANLYGMDLEYKRHKFGFAMQMGGTGDSSNAFGAHLYLGCDVNGIKVESRGSGETDTEAKENACEQLWYELLYGEIAKNRAGIILSEANDKSRKALLRFGAGETWKGIASMTTLSKSNLINPIGVGTYDKKMFPNAGYHQWDYYLSPFGFLVADMMVSR